MLRHERGKACRFRLRTLNHRDEQQRLSLYAQAQKGRTRPERAAPLSAAAKVRAEAEDDLQAAEAASGQVQEALIAIRLRLDQARNRGNKRFWAGGLGDRVQKGRPPLKPLTCKPETSKELSTNVRQFTDNCPDQMYIASVRPRELGSTALTVN